MSTLAQTTTPRAPDHAGADADTPLVSVVIPCLNEAENIESCVTAALAAIEAMGVRGEVVVADNDSEDESARLAELAGAGRGRTQARLRQRLPRGVRRLARGVHRDGRRRPDLRLRRDPRFVAALQDGAEMAIGDRMDNIQPGAMPWLHQYVGNPILTGLLNFFFRTGISDAHCGMRALRREVLPRLDLRTTGMEFASEMVIRAAKEKLTIAEFPIEYHPRGGESKLSSFRDGWRHLRFLLVHSPNHLFIVPGTILAGLGTLIVVVVGAGVDFFGRAWVVHALIGGALLMIVGTQVLALGLCAHAYGTYFMGEQDPWFHRMRSRFRLEHGLLLGGVFSLVGLVMGGLIVATWIAHGFGSLSDEHLAVIAATLLIVGIQIFFPPSCCRSSVCAAASVRPLRRIAAVVFAGDARIWKAAAVAAVPLLALIAFYGLRPRDYYTGTDSVEAYTYIAETSAGEPMCVPGLEIPAGTGRIRLQLISRTRTRPALHMALMLTGPAEQTIDGTLAPVTVPSNRISAAVFEIPRLGSHPAERSATLCVTAGGLVNWGGTPLPAVPSPAPPTAGGHPLTGRIAVWYEPPAGSQRSYASRLGAILDRASLFRPSPVGPWLYVLILFVALPGLALASVRCLGSGARRRRRESGPDGGVAVCDRRDELRLLGADHASVSGARRGRPLRLYAVARPARGSALAQPRLAAGALVGRGDAGAGRHGLLQRPPGRRHARSVDLASAGRIPRAGRRQAPKLLRRRRQRDGRDAWRDLLRGAGARVPARLQLAVLPADVDAPDLGADRCVDGRVRVPARGAGASRPAVPGYGCSRRCSWRISRCTGSSPARSTTTWESTPGQLRWSCC